ncbi:uncharacterized protein LOC126661864 [Mercurialis annua]|uniref:uncharacterized protein LOC126661864 n=1 Tax=Mercurialis annua TaxID=3986 RepID=UPI00215EE8F0|nr:uncharacterized protein LOC126661864 [Mercurialis annua]
MRNQSEYEGFWSIKGEVSKKSKRRKLERKIKETQGIRFSCMHNTRRANLPLEPYHDNLGNYERSVRRRARIPEVMNNEGNNYDEQGRFNPLMDEGEQQYPPAPPLGNANRPRQQDHPRDDRPQNRCAFFGLSHEDPNEHIAKFLGVLNTFKLHGITADQIKLQMFPFSLTDKASIWLHSLPNESIHNWRELAQDFLNKYFPHGKTTKLTKDILEFVQFEGESLHEAWERFKDLQRSVPHHRLNREHVIQIFYDGTNVTTRATIDAASGGSLMQKTYEEALELVEKLAVVSSTWGPMDRRAPTTQKSLMTLDQVREMESIKAANASLQAQVDALKKQVAPMQRNAPVAYVQVGCEFCGDFGHSGGECLVTGQALSEQVNYTGGQRPPQQQGHYEGNQGPGYNYGGRPQHPPGFQPQRNVDDGNVLYKVLEKLDKMDPRELDARQREKNQASTIHHLETQISQLAINLQGRPQGGLPSTTETNPREHVKAIKVVEL